VIELHPTTCQQCGHLFMGNDPEPSRRQISELPRVKAEVTEYRQLTLQCVACGVQTRVESAEITTDEHLIRFRITASHFLWKMVRWLIGSLVEVGRGRASVEDFARLIENPRSQSPLVPARVTAPPSGLFLESVDY
jgi:tRNA pseudouridine synthase/zinc-finger binding domain of transposase IS66